MAQRILFHPYPTADWLKGLKVETLGKNQKGSWVSAEDEDALDLLKRDKSTAMLYPSREDYMEAIEGLNEPEIAEAVEKRLQVWTAEAESWILPYLFEREKIFLSSLAASSAASDSKVASAARGVYLRQLSLLDKTLIDSRYRRWEATDLLSAVFEDLNYLNRDLESLESRFGGKLPPQDEGLKSARLALAVNLEKAMQRHGLKKGVPATGKVHANIKRGAFIAPIDRNLVEGLQEAHRPVQEWKDGFVTPWEDWDLPSLEKRGKKIEILYFSEDEFLSDYLPATPAQRPHRFQRASRWASGTGPADHVADLQLTWILTAGNAGPLLADKEAQVSGEIDRQREREAEALRVGLAAPAKGKQAMPASLTAAGEAGGAEVSFWLAWAAASRWMDIQEDLGKILIEKRDMSAALRKAGLI